MDFILWVAVTFLSGSVFGIATMITFAILLPKKKDWNPETHQLLADRNEISKQILASLRMIEMSISDISETLHREEE